MSQKLLQKSFADTFDGLDRHDLPALSSLAGLAVPDKSKVMPLADFDARGIGKAAPEVRRIFSSVTRLCRAAELSPQFVEVAIWPDAKALRKNDVSFFVSYLGANLDAHQSEVMGTYAEAMDHMIARNNRNEGDGIVLHDDMYNQDLAYFSRPLATRILPSKAGLTEESSSEQAQVDRLVSSCHLYRVDTPNSLSSKFPLPDQVNIFVDKFMANLADRGDRNADIARFQEGLTANGLFLLVPFLRPLSDVDDDTGAMADMGRDLPGGCIFLFLTGSKDAIGEAPRLVRRLHWLMAQAQLVEAQRVRDDIARTRDILGSTLHTAGNILQSSGMPNLLNKLVYPDRAARERRSVSLEDLRFHLINVGTGERDLRAEGELLRMVFNAAIATYRTTTMLAFAEMALEGGLLREKFQNDNQIRLVDILQSALTSANTFQPKVFTADRGELPMLTADLSKVSPDIVFPKRYVAGDVLAGLFAELFINARRHATSEDGEVRAQVEAKLHVVDGDKQLQITWRNRSHPSEKSAVETGGYLYRSNTSLKQARLGGMTSRTRKGHFEITLTLGSVLAQQSISDFLGTRISPELIDRGGGGGGSSGAEGGVHKPPGKPSKSRSSAHT